MISDKLVYVPTTSPKSPTITITAFFNTINTFSAPLICFQYVNNWIIAGNTNPNAERHKAPNREMNSSKLGIATASKTGKIEVRNNGLDYTKQLIFYLHVTNTCERFVEVK